MDYGLSWDEAHRISYEELQLILIQWQYAKTDKMLSDAIQRVEEAPFGEERKIKAAVAKLTLKRIENERQYYAEYK